MGFKSDYTRMRMSRQHIRTLPTAAAMLWLLCGCVKKSEYDALQVENQTLQTRVDEANHLLVQSQSDLSVLHIQMQQFVTVQAQLHETQQELKQSQSELQVLKTQFNHFRTQRRSAMVGKKLPLLSLDDGKVLQGVEITAVGAEEISLQHSGGIIKVVLAKTTPDLRWEACYDPLEAKEKAGGSMPGVGHGPETRLARQQDTPPPTPVPTPAATAPTRHGVDLLRTRLASQRQQLNTDYQALAAKNPVALRGVAWDSSTPEANPLLNSLSGSRAVLGIGRLQTQRDTIRTTLRQLRDLDPAAR
jgi:hypothetical protein